MKKIFIQKNPSHPGEILYEFQLKPLKISITAAAEKLSMTRAELAAIVKGRAKVTPEIAKKFAKAYNTSAQFWLNLQCNYDLAEAIKNGKPYEHLV